MSKTTPVRWWRDDATRYRPRPPYVAPQVEQPLWAFELLSRPLAPALVATMEALRLAASPERLASMCAVPLNLLGLP